MHEPPDLTAVPDGLRPVLAACLAKDPAQRPTPDGLLDLFVPDPATYSPTVVVPPLPSYAPPSAVPPHQAPTEPAPVGGASADADLAFVATSQTGSLLIDAVGVALGSEAGRRRFKWAEIRTVEYAPEGPKNVKVTVHLHNGATHECLLAARRRAQLREWLEDLPLILECFL